MTSKNRSSQAIVYDPQAHREFVTGFRKRKQARRQQAQADIQRNAKEERRQLRQEKRDFFKNSRLRLLPHDSDEDSDEDADDAVVHTFDAEDGAVVTASVAPLETPSSRPPPSATQTANPTDPQRETDRPKAASAPPPKLPARSTIRKPKSRRRHVSYTHAHHKPRPAKGKANRTTHSQRRKRGTTRAGQD